MMYSVLSSSMVYSISVLCLRQWCTLSQCCVFINGVLYLSVVSSSMVYSISVLCLRQWCTLSQCCVFVNGVLYLTVLSISYANLHIQYHGLNMKVYTKRCHANTILSKSYYVIYLINDATPYVTAVSGMQFG